MVIKRLRSIVLGVAVAAIMSSAVSAGPQQLKFEDSAALHKWGQTNGGGPFEAEPIGFGFTPQGLYDRGDGTMVYLSFCVELDEGVGATTYDAKINTKAIGGGGGPNPDPLDARTAFLYTAFIKGTLDDKLAAAFLLPFTYGAAASGEALQEVIWRIEQEKTSALAGLAADILALADTAVAFGGEWYGKGNGHVKILNLTKNGAQKQDQLILIPLPLPAAMALAGLLGVGVFSYRRRRMV